MRQRWHRALAMLVTALLISLVGMSTRTAPVEAVVLRSVAVEDARRVAERSGISDADLVPGAAETTRRYARRVADRAAGALLPAMRAGYALWIADDVHARGVFEQARTGQVDCRRPLYLDDRSYEDQEIASWSALPFYAAEAEGGLAAARARMHAISGIWTFAHWVYHLERVCRGALPR